MTDHHEVELRRWIQEAAAMSAPIEIDDIMVWAPVDLDRSLSADVIDVDPAVVEELGQRTPGFRNRGMVILAVAAALVAIVAFALTTGGGGDSEGVGVATESDEPTVTVGQVEVATAFWEAVAAGDRETALGYVDPAEVDSGFLAVHGRAFTLDGKFDWYEAVGWQWQLGECATATVGEDTVVCTVSARNAWSDALGLESITGSYVVRLSEDGIIELRNPLGEFGGAWNAQVFGVFQDWVQENHPNDAEIMFNFTVDVNDEILRLYELNTARFIAAQSSQ